MFNLKFDFILILLVYIGYIILFGFAMIIILLIFFSENPHIMYHVFLIHWYNVVKKKVWVNKIKTIK